MNSYKFLPAAAAALIVAVPAAAQVSKPAPSMATSAMGGKSNANTSRIGVSKATAARPHKTTKHRTRKGHAKAAKSGM